MNKILANVKRLLLVLGDIIALFGALAITLFTRYGTSWFQELTGQHLLPFTIVYILWIVVFYIQGLYDFTLVKNNITFVKRFFESLVINALISVAFFYLVPGLGIAPRTNLATNLVFAAVFIYGWRITANQIFSTGWLVTRVLFIGLNDEVFELGEKLQANPQFGFLPTAVIDLDGIKRTPSGIKRWDVKTSVIEAARRAGISLVVISPGAKTIIAGRDELGRRLAGELYRAVLERVQIVDLPSFSEQVLGRVPLSTITELWFLEHLRESQKKIYEAGKIVFDYILGAVLFALFAVTFPLVALLLLLFEGRPLFYSQERVGKNGKILKIFKYRTMVRGAEANGPQFAKTRDPRVTAVGAFLRRTRIDELPQIINILRGEMSFIGPRPERPEFVKKLVDEAPFYQARHLVKPGLTGWAQINYPYAGTIEENIKKLQYDLYYIKNRSLALDLTIILKTLPIIFGFKGQ